MATSVTHPASATPRTEPQAFEQPRARVVFAALAAVGDLRERDSVVHATTAPPRARVRESQTLVAAHARNVRRDAMVDLDEVASQPRPRVDLASPADTRTLGGILDDACWVGAVRLRAWTRLARRLRRGLPLLGIGTCMRVMPPLLASRRPAPDGTRPPEPRSVRGGARDPFAASHRPGPVISVARRIPSHGAGRGR